MRLLVNRLEKLNNMNKDLITCRKCPRLVEWRERVARDKKAAYRQCEYWGKPVPGFGDSHPKVLVVGLAPGAHGSNRTGRMFTGDGSGRFLFQSLYRCGYGSKPESLDRDDDLTLDGLYISALARCAPPANKPTPDEFRNCRPYLEFELDLFDDIAGIVALGGLAFTHVRQIFKAKGFQPDQTTFGHNALSSLGDGAPWLLASYHPSLQNTQTGKLTPAMFDEIWLRAKQLSEG